MSSISLAGRSLRRRRARTFLTVSGIVVGVAMILVLLSLAAGTSARTSGLLNNVLGAEITVVNGTTPTFRGGGFGGGGFGGGSGAGGGGTGGGFGGAFGTSNTVSQSLVPEIANVTGVLAATPQLTTTGYVAGNSAFIFGIDPRTYAIATNGLNIVGGSNLTSSDTDGIVLAKPFADGLGLGVGSIVMVGSLPTSGANYTVVGIYDPGSTFGASARSAYVQLANAQGISNETGKVTEVYVKATNPSGIAALATEIGSISTGIRAVTSGTFTSAASSLSGTLSSFFTVIGLVALIAGGFGVINTMMMSITERTREIGTMRAIGASARHVMKTFLTEALIIGVVGGVAGVVIGIAVVFVLPQLSGSGGGGPGGPFGLLSGSLTPALTAQNVGLSFVLGAAVGGLAGIYPAWRVSRLDPAEALRHA